MRDACCLLMTLWLFSLHGHIAVIPFVYFKPLLVFYSLYGFYFKASLNNFSADFFFSKP